MPKFVKEFGKSITAKAMGFLTVDDLPPGVYKKSIKSGWGPEHDFQLGTKITFHFKTYLADSRELVDDSVTLGKPMEVIIGKQFKLEIWEVILRTLSDNEIAEFTVKKEYNQYYPMVAKILRDSQRPKESVSRSCCGMMTQGCGYPDLDKLMEYPQDLIYLIEVCCIEHVGDYVKESWQMSSEEKLLSIPELKVAGNTLFQNNDFPAALAKYCEAIGRVEQLALREKPGSEESLKLEAIKVPLLLNYGFCLMKQSDYYNAIQHFTSVLDIDPSNVKALFRRGACHTELGSTSEARADLKLALELDQGLKKVVNEQLVRVSDHEKMRDEEDRKKYQKLF